MIELYLNILALDAITGFVLSPYERSVLHRLNMDYISDKNLISSNIEILEELVNQYKWERPDVYYVSKDKEGLMCYNPSTGGFDRSIKYYDHPIIEHVNKLFKNNQ